ncbi:MAG: hypothetical protein QXM43_00405 [Desulfurococcaceae archaeon]
MNYIEATIWTAGCNLKIPHLKRSHCSYEIRIENRENVLLTGRCPGAGSLMFIKHRKPVFKVNKNGEAYGGSLLPPFKNRVTLGEDLTPVSRVEGILVKNEEV